VGVLGRFLILSAALIALIVVTGVANQFVQRAPGSAGGPCTVDPPRWLAGSEPAQIVASFAQPGVTLVDARWDEAALIVGLCVEDAADDTEVAFQRGSTTLQPSGAAFGMAEGSHGGLLYLIWPAIDAGDGELVTSSGVLGVLRSAWQMDGRCALRSGNPDVTLDACGGILVAQWNTGLRIASADVELVDVAILDDADARPLGFYLIGTADSAEGLRVTFGFMPPAGNGLTVRLQDLYPSGLTKSLPLEIHVPLEPAT
jgi:hypothetical protein